MNSPVYELIKDSTKAYKEGEEIEKLWRVEKDYAKRRVLHRQAVDKFKECRRLSELADYIELRRLNND